MKIVDKRLGDGHLSVIVVPNVQVKPTITKSKFNDADEIDYRWLWFAVRLERYKKSLGGCV